MDVLWNLQYLVPSPKFGGCVEHNTQEEYDALRWEDERPKPTWDEIVNTVVPAPLPIRLDEMFQTLPVEARAQFFPLKAAVKLALEQGDIEAAKYIVQLTTVPSELEAAKAQMLGVFG